jgi:hypothetical protein
VFNGWRRFLPRNRLEGWYLRNWLRLRCGRLECNFHRVGYQGEAGTFRKQGMLGRHAETDLNGLRQEAVFRKCYRLAFRAHCQRTGCLTGLILRSVHVGARGL